MSHADVRRMIALAALGVTLAACQAAPGPQSAAVKPRASKAQPQIGGSAEPGPAASQASSKRTPASPAAPAADSAPAALLKPATPSRTLAGVVRIDAAYAFATTGARIITNNGATAIQAAGQVLSNNTGNLIANNSGSLIANNSGSLVGNNGSAYSLAELPAPPALGTILPAAGLVLTARSLRTGEPVSLGVDAAGEPVTAVLTNSAGTFELYVPQAVERLVFEARFPGEAASDRRLAYDLLPAGAGASLVIDEDTAQVTRYMREALRGTIAKFVLTDDVETTVADVVDDAAEGLIAPLTALIREFRGVSGEVGLDRAPPAEVQRVATRMTDVLLAHLDLEAVKLTQAYWPDWKGPEEPAIPALIDIMRRVREASTAKLTADAAFFERQPYLAAANAALPAGRPPFAIRKPADLNEFLVQALVIPNKHHDETEAIFTSIGVATYQSERLYAAVNNYIGVMTLLLIADTEGAKTDALAVLRAFEPDASP